MNYKHRQTRKPGQRVHVVRRGEGRIKKLDWSSREPPAPKAITMPARTLRMLTDAEVGLPDDPVAQQSAETYIAAWIGWGLKQDIKAQAARIKAIEVKMDDEALVIRDVPQAILDGISAELRRIAERPSRSH